MKCCNFSNITDYTLLKEEAEHNANHPSLLLVIGYTNGVQIWCVPVSMNFKCFNNIISFNLMLYNLSTFW